MFIRVKIIKYLALASWLLSFSAYAGEDLNFQSPEQCKVFAQKYFDLAYNHGPSNQGMYAYFFRGLGYLHTYKESDECHNGQCVYTKTTPGCNLVKANIKNSGPDTANILWNQVIPVVQQEITNFNNNVPYDRNYGTATVTCPYTAGQKINYVLCTAVIS